jgi:molybdate transport system permease protein
VNELAFPLWLSLRVACLATAIALPLGIAMAHLQAGATYRGRSIVGTLVLLPLVLPPSVTGYYLVVLLGHDGVLGAPLHRATGISIMFTFWACVVASTVVALPLVVRSVQAAFESLDPAYEELARTLGASRVATFFRVRLPLVRHAVLAGGVLAFARGLGEFGATMMLAGNVPGRTNTMPLEVYSAYIAGDDGRAHVLAFVLMVTSALVLLLSERFARRAP